jgi:hypothetical protein
MPPDSTADAGTGIWAGFEAAADRLDSAMDFREIVLYEWTREYDATTGDYDYSLSEAKRLHAQLRQSTRPSVLRSDPAGSGGDAEVDVECYLPTDELAEAAGWDTSGWGTAWGGNEAVEIVPSGRERRATVFEDAATRARYTVQSMWAERNGLLRCRGVER